MLNAGERIKISLEHGFAVLKAANAVFWTPMSETMRNYVHQLLFPIIS